MQSLSMVTPQTAPKYQAFTAKDLSKIPQLQALPEETRFAMRVVATVLPFRVNRYVIENLIDWDAVPDDSMFRVAFPQREMLHPDQFDEVAGMLRREATAKEMAPTVQAIRETLNPHPAEQQRLNVPFLDDERVDGLQHKYSETVLVFPSHGQTCHTYCTFCFRWAQFVQNADYRLATSGYEPTLSYLERHREVTDVLFTGGDPMVMNANRLADYLLPILEPRFEHIRTVRIGTKALSFWPYRFVTDRDADEVLALFERIVQSGKQLALMAHYDHWRELEPAMARRAIQRVRATGAVIRSQGPILGRVNDSAETWARSWTTQVQLGIVPYYMFMERDTGARRYFEVPVPKALEAYQGAFRSISGVARTARGPVMSAGPGKVHVQGTIELDGRRHYVLSLLQGRRSEWVGKPFLTKYDPEATWLTDLKPADGDAFFYESEYAAIQPKGAPVEAS